VLTLDTWSRRFLSLAKEISTWSKDPSTRVGAVIVRPNKEIVSVGFNGFPRGKPDLPELLNDRDKKYLRTVHAEINALVFAKQDISGCTLYTYPFLPCATCSAVFCQTGIAEVVSFKTDNPRWAESIGVAIENFEDCGIKITEFEQEQ